MNRLQAGDVTQALVLAAGRGSRIGQSDSKPLFPILGVPLLARTLFTLEKGGITDAYVVLGYEGDRVRSEIGRIDRLRIRVHWIHNERWQEPNGVSVLASASALEGPFLLTMSDHLFEVEAVERLRARVNEPTGIYLVVDQRTAEINDLEDATKVRLDGDRIVDLNKSLAHFDAIDTGVFLTSPVLFEALRGVEGAAAPSLSDGVRKLADEGRAWAVDGSDLMWQDVDTRSDANVAAKKLLSQWPKKTDGPISRLINRPLSTRITQILVNTPVTPNQVSVVTLILGLAAGWLAAMGGYGNWLATGLLFQVASILDGTDGELATLTYQGSEFGAWVDTICDNVSYIVFLVGLTVGVHTAGLPSYYVWSGVIGIAAAALSLANINFYLLREGKSGSALTVRYSHQSGEGSLSTIMRFVHYLGKRDLLSFLVLALAALGQLPLALPLFGVGATLFLLPATTAANLSRLPRTRRMAPAEGGLEE